MKNKIFDVIDINRPPSSDIALNLVKFNSKLSPLVANFIEVETCNFLNQQKHFQNIGVWERQDPDFPDVILNSNIFPSPGFEIKAWFPLATEMTARFKDSQNAFLGNQTNVAIIAWLPEFLIYGKPKVIDVFVTSAQSIAQARDKHYFNPPDYLITEPLDTSMRTRNLQQSNTSGYKWQSTDSRVKNEAESLVQNFGDFNSSIQDRQRLVNILMQSYQYRLDTNYAKLDRINHFQINKFINDVYNINIYGRKIREWYRLFQADEQAILEGLKNSRLL
ncbi:hypothetical protein IR141_09540 [Neisseria sp. 19428wB4_WF04]|nr:hypothetical protein [Neisseria sp. 19428wB4_WF04]TFU40436.1 hypothetical protein E4T99_09490 [Neisseria sp. WF04]